MIISEIYNRPNLPSQLRIYSNQGYFLQKENQLFREVYINKEEEISEYTETNLPLPPAFASNDFIYNSLITNNQLTEPQILAAQPIIEKALNQLEDEDAYLVSFLYKPVDAEKEYQIGERFLYNNILYTTIQKALGNHIFDEDFSAYFIKTECPNDYVDEWKIGKTYQQNERVKYGEHVYKSLIDNNTWTPQEFLAAWELIQ